MIARRRAAIVSALAGRSKDSEAGVAMLLALFVIATLVTISITVAGITLSQVKPTQLDRKSVVTEDAAEGGFDAALNRIRTAYTGTTTNSRATSYRTGTFASCLAPCPGDT